MLGLGLGLALRPQSCGLGLGLEGPGLGLGLGLEGPGLGLGLEGPGLVNIIACRLHFPVGGVGWGIVPLKSHFIVLYH